MPSGYPLRMGRATFSLVSRSSVFAPRSQQLRPEGPAASHPWAKQLAEAVIGILGAVADVVDLKTALTIGAIAPSLGVLFCLRLPPTPASTFVVDPDQGDKELTFHFCPECGATVFFTGSDAPDVIAVPVGAFADPSFPPPTVSVFDSRRHPWLVVPTAIERHD